MKRDSGTFLFIALALAMLLPGCWGSSKSTSVSVGGGGGVLATATAVGIDKCYNCHANTAIDGTRIFEGWALSRHANYDNSYDGWDDLVEGTTSYHGYRPGYDPAEQDTCGVCHNPNDDALNLAMYVGPGSGTTPRFVVGCEACHGGGSLHFGVGPIGGPTLGEYAVAASTGQSSQYNTCRSCHGDTFHTTRTYRLISDTHFDNGARAVGSDIQGYVIRKALNTSCTDCHLTHRFSLVENRAWHLSAHGDFAGAAWNHYDWKQSNRQACQRCHTTTGYVNYTSDQASYNPANNVFVATDNQSEMLYCYGCHQVDEGGMMEARRTVASAYLPGGPGANDNVEITGKGNSELCINCHSGREAGSQVKAILAGLTNPGGADNVSFGTFNSHYLAAAGTLFQDNTFSAADNTFTGPGAYQFPGKNYAKVSYFEHDSIPYTTGNGEEGGPCVGCHMSSPNNDNNYETGTHSFMPVIHDNNDVMTELTSTKCAECHAGAYTITVDDLNTLEEEYDARKDELQTALESIGIYYNSGAYPYFYADAAFTTQFKTWQSEAASLGIATADLIGAAFNLNYLTHDPGAYVHNDIYTNRVLYDSIEKVGATPSFARP